MTTAVGLHTFCGEFDVEAGTLGVPHQDLSTSQPIASSTRLLMRRVFPMNSVTLGRLDLTSTAKLELLHPFDAASTDLHDRDVNNDSLVLKLTYGDVRILFTGDIGRKVELKLVESGKDLRAEIVKVPHHGSKTSSSPEFLDAVRPQYAIFSLGQRNRYRFPSKAVVERYRERGCHILRDRIGWVLSDCGTDGRRCWITHHVEGR